MSEAETFPNFEAVFKALNRYRPYLWQARLAREIAETGKWPDALAAPTGAGKTAVIDIALYHLAKEAALAQRRAPLRIVFAVNRRVIVDQAFDRAQAIAKKLASVTDGPLLEVRDALAGLSGESQLPLHVEQLRGGLPREDDWARTPSQPTVLCTTIDQLGSRLLFRGYGVSDRMAPIHAGLLGNDTLILLDEAHLSDAFSETIAGVARWRGEADQAPPLPFITCRLTATPRDGDKAFSLLEDERAEEAIAKRLQACKRAELIASKVTAKDNDKPSDVAERQAAEFSELAKDLVKDITNRQPVLAIVVNRVKLAREIFKALSANGDSKEPAHDVILLTGRVRPIERDALIAEYGDRLQGKRTGEKPLFVVATQCIEAGADFDFDAMVTQIASLDALIQRFGRLARGGNRVAGKPAPAVILAPKVDIAAKTDDPVYGGAMKAAWDWLQAHKTSEGKGKTKSDWIDFGPDAMAALIASDPDAAAAAMSPRLPAPFLREADANFFSITSPRPDPEPDLRLFLHGRIDVETDVSIVWRADLEEHDLQPKDGTEPRAAAIIEAMPTRPGEALSIPVWHARRWLEKASKEAANVADQPGTAPSDDRTDGTARPFLRLRGGEGEREGEVFTRAADIRPSDTIIVPASYGGCDQFGWHPESDAPVDDIADLAAAPYRAKRLRVRLHETLWKQHGLQDILPWADARDLIRERSASKPIAKALKTALGGGEQDRENAYLSALLAMAERSRSARPTTPYRPRAEEDDVSGCVLIAGAATVSTGAGDDASSHTAPEELSVHAGKVQDKAAGYARALGLPERLAESLKQAAFLHDDGKTDERFQAYLQSFVGTEWNDKVLAKTGVSSSGRKGAWKAAGLPEAGWRHEVVSVKLAIERLAELGDTVDHALILWLVGTHHGYGRPFFQHVDDWEDEIREVNGISLPAVPGPHRLDFEWDGPGTDEKGLDWPGLFALLKRRYGIWGLAYLEAVVRLADHRASEESALTTAESSE